MEFSVYGLGSMPWLGVVLQCSRFSVNALNGGACGRIENVGHVCIVAMNLSVAEVLVGLATETPVCFSRRGGALEVNTLTFTIRASDSAWHPGLPGRPLFREAARWRLWATSALLP